MERQSDNHALRKLQLVELDILKETIQILNSLKLKYYITDGTFLGAVRHKGFIPWDDDIDISMPRKDYEKFVESAPRFLPSHLKMVNFKKDKDCIDYMTKVVNEKYKLLHTHPIKHREISVWIDIFPLDGMPNNKLLRKVHGFNLLVKRALFKFSLFDELVNINNNKRPWYEKVLVEVGKIIKFEKVMDYHKRMNSLDHSLKKYDFYDSNYVISFAGAYKLKSIMHKSIYGHGKKYLFEGVSVIGPEKYDRYLKTLYNDYMKLPPPEERNWHGNEIIDK